MQNKLRQVNQILVYSALKVCTKVGDEIKKNLILSLNNIYGILDEANDGEVLLHLYDANKKYIGFIDLKCPHTITNIIWGNEEE